jgi:glycosyltransferase involved in cell wall biosynthesis
MSSGKESLFLYAPNVHTGGGFTLLNELMLGLPKNLHLIAWLDIRVKDNLSIPKNVSIKWVKPKLSSRLGAEFSLFMSGNIKTKVLCFHGLPPLFPNKSKIFLFFQNRNLITNVDLKSFLWSIRVRIILEKFMCWLFRYRVHLYWVQTNSMATALQSWYGRKKASIQVLPFAPSPVTEKQVGLINWDFIYVADGAGHKNHRKLIQAWIVLSNQGLKPSLALTLTARDHVLKEWITNQVAMYDLRVTNLGALTREEVQKLYFQAKALIFPSLSESYGLPLVEAMQADLPIIAGELDFVRDVCEPIQCFDPTSSNSIARAVLRFFGKSPPLIKPASAIEFLKAMVQHN